MTTRTTKAALPLVLVSFALGCTRSSADPQTRGGARGPDSGAPPKVATELVLERALPLELDWDFEPSGLLWFGDHLLTVSDKHDDTVFELVLGETSAKVRPFIRFEPPASEPRPFDFEGLASEGGGAILVASEARHRVLRVTVDGEADWATPSLQATGARAGMFQKRNAGLEGIARLPSGHLLLAAERQPRGLIELTAPATLDGALAWTMNESTYAPPPGRNLDFADLATDGARVYALERNSHLVVRIERDGARWVEREAWSYARSENDPRFAYEDQEYGVAEGLALDEARVYVVLDNNNDRRRGTRDARPLLFVFQRPR